VPPEERLDFADDEATRSKPFKQRLRIMQIIAGSLLLAVVIFSAIVLLLVQVLGNGQGFAPAAQPPILSYVALAMFVIEAPIAFLVPPILVRSALRKIVAGTWQPAQTSRSGSFVGAITTSRTERGEGNVASLPEETKLFIVRQSTMIIGMAMLEGVAFTGCMAYMMEATNLSLAIIGLTLVLQLCKFPTANTVRSWIERQQEAMAELRQQQESTGY
jgi:hypothetical protein